MLLLPILTKWLGIMFLWRKARFFSSDLEKLFVFYSSLQCCSMTLSTSIAALCFKSIEFSASIAERSGRPMPNPVPLGETPSSIYSFGSACRIYMSSSLGLIFDKLSAFSLKIA